MTIDFRHKPPSQKTRIAFSFLALLVFFFAPAYSLFSQEDAAASAEALAVATASAVADSGDGTVVGVEVTGLRRTREHIILYPLQRFVGMPAAEIDFAEVRGAVLDTGVLDTVSEELVQTEDGLILYVTVWEMWSIFPAPVFFMTGGGDFNFGFFFADANAFGARHMMVLGGMYGTFGWMGMTLFQYRPTRSGLPELLFLTIYQDSDVRNLDRYETVHRRYSTSSLRFLFGIEQPLSENLSVFFNTRLNHLTIREDEASFNHPQSGATHLRFNPGVSLQTRSRDAYFLSVQGLSLGYYYNWGIPGNSFHEVEFQGVFERPIAYRLRWSIRSGAVWRSGSDPLAEDGPQSAQVHILPGRFSAMHYAGLSLGMERVIARFNWGFFTVLGSMQSVFSYGPIGGRQFDWGPTGELRMYLTRLPLPAFGLNTAYNVSSRRFQLSITVGMEM
ncbi:MAG: BamA/TamA family outer membrane protein [Spirochaetes bacterium]|nr:BamA/TamA family outer membrane protein [Spirochaetota bacterium]